MEFSLALLLNNLDQIFWLILLITARFIGAMSLCPIFSDERMTKMLKVLLSLLFACILFPSLLSSVKLGHTSMLFRLLLLVKEFAYGAAFSYLISFPIWMIENVGNLIDLQRGEQFGAIVNQLTKNPSSSIAKLLLQGFITYFVIANGFLFFFQLVFASFAIIPIDKLVFINPLLNSQIYIRFFANYFYWMVVFSLPVLFLMFVMEITLGLISSFVPQLNVTVLSMPLKSAIAIFILIFYVAPLYHGSIAKVMLPVKAAIYKT